MKCCTKCGIEKYFSLFSRDARYKDGYFCWCRQCRSMAARGQKREKKRRPYSEMSPEQKARHRTNGAAWVRNNSKKQWAQNKVKKAIKAKRLIPWPVCAVPECESKPEAHHPDYDAPLSVVWLCRSHHSSVHGLMRRIY